MSPAASNPGVPGFRITAGGSPVDADVLSAIDEIVVDGRLSVPDRLTLRLLDDDETVIAADTFAAGTAITVTLGAADEVAQGPVFDGQVTTLAADYRQGNIVLTVLALDRGCLLQRAPVTATYQSMSYGEIASKLATSVGLQAGTIESGLSLAFVQQSNETPWEFLWRLARDVDYEVKVTGRQLHFRPAGGPASGQPLALEFGEELWTFSPRVSAVQQVDSVEVRGWDPVAAQAISASASPGATQSTPGMTRASVAGALGSGTAAIVDHPFVNQAQATTVAKSVATQIANAFVEGEGLADGNPKLRAGGRITIKGIAAPFAGTYALSGVRHVLRSSTGYTTEFFISGREDRSLFGLAGGAPAGREGWGRRVVVGVVTNNDDPERNGRVRVRYPALDDSHEGWWARVVAPGAGASRGLLTLPEAGDEVLIVFEHENEGHPYVLGSVYNGQALPGDLSTTDGSFGLFSDKQLVVKAKDNISFNTEKDLTLDATGDAKLTTQKTGEISAASGLTAKSDQSLTLKAQTNGELIAQTGLKLDGGTQVEIGAQGQVTIKAASIQLQASGVVQISAAQVLLG